jgi:transketolase
MAINWRFEDATYRISDIVGDGECNEGSVCEVCLCAHKHKLNNLTVVGDCNKHQSYSTTYETLDLEQFADKWRSFGFVMLPKFQGVAN